MRGIGVGIIVAALSGGAAFAKVDEQQAARLGAELTPTGAERAGNADGSIPEWSGRVVGLPSGVEWKGPEQPYPDPFGGEKPLFSIGAVDVERYAARLSEGQKALFRTYPKSFRMDVYPTHRDFGYGEDREARARHNVLHAQLVNGDDGIEGYTGGVPFPIPVLGAEPIWNSRLNSPSADQQGLGDDIAVYPNGTRAVRRGRSGTRA
jgi:hypothetical protein